MRLRRWVDVKRSKSTKHLSGLLQEEILTDTPPATLGELLDSLEGRGLAAALGLLAFPIAIPLPLPGISAIFGLPMMVIALQIVLRRKSLWLPGGLRKRKLNLKRLHAVGTKAAKWLKALEKLLRPRLAWLFAPPFEILYGVLSAWLAITLFLPIPFGNVLPSLSIFLLAIAMLERDGVAALAGVALSIGSIVFTFAALVAGASAVWGFFQKTLAG